MSRLWSVGEEEKDDDDNSKRMQMRRGERKRRSSLLEIHGPPRGSKWSGDVTFLRKHTSREYGYQPAKESRKVVDPGCVATARYTMLRHALTHREYIEPKSMSVPLGEFEVDGYRAEHVLSSGNAGSVSLAQGVRATVDVAWPSAVYTVDLDIQGRHLSS